MSSVLDILGLSSIANGLQVSTRPTDFSFLLATNISTIVPMSVFVILAGIGIFFTAAKAYHDTVFSMVNVAPKLVTLIYVLAAWTISVALVYMSYWIGHLTVTDETSSSGALAKYLFLENISVQFLRWSFVLGGFLMSYGPLLLLPPYERQATIKDQDEQRPPQSKFVRYSLLAGFTLIALFQLFLSFEWVILLTYSPWFAMSIIEGLCVGLCYMFVALFYLYSGWYAVVKKERKEDALLSDGLDKASILRKLRAAMCYAKRSSRCKHGMWTQCSTCRKKSFLGTKTFLVIYSISFTVTLLASMAEQAYFWWFDLTLLLERSALTSFPGIVTLAFGIITFFVFVACTVVLFNRAYRANKSKKIIDKRKSIIPAADVQKTNELTEDTDNDNQNPQDNDGQPRDYIALDVHESNSGANSQNVQLIEQPQITAQQHQITPASAPNLPTPVQEAPVVPQPVPQVINNRSSLFQPVPSQDSLPRISAQPQPSTLQQEQYMPAPSAKNTMRKSSTASKLVQPSKQNTLPNKRVEQYATINNKNQSMTMRPQQYQQNQQFQQLPSYSEHHAVRDPTMQSLVSQTQTEMPAESPEEIRAVSMRNSDSFNDVFQSIPIENQSIPESLNNEEEPEEEQSLSIQDIRNIIQWLEKSERISVPRGMIQFSQQKPELVYEELVHTMSSISPAIFAHLDCWLLARVEKDMDQLEQMISSSTPDTFSPQLKTVYPGIQAVGKFKELFANMFPNINSDLLEFDAQFRSAQDTFLFLMCLHVLMNYS